MHFYAKSLFLVWINCLGAVKTENPYPHKYSVIKKMQGFKEKAV